MSNLITVLSIGRHLSEEATVIPGMLPFEESGFSVTNIETEKDLEYILAKNHFNAICTFGDAENFSTMNAQSLEIRKRWLHFEDPLVSEEIIASSIFGCFLGTALTNRFPQVPLISVFTPTHKTGIKLITPYDSLCSQTYDNWEWIIYDDSPDLKTFEVASALAASDHRIKVFRSSEHCGRIGEVKRRCCGLARGDIFVELDHDDQLLPNCLNDIVEAFTKFPDAGFAYTDCAEVYDNGENLMYPEGFALGFGSYRYEEFEGKVYAVNNCPSINSKTVRHIVGMPNHARAWKRDAYFAAGGYQSEIHVADDYELCIRTFLTTRMVHIKRFGYIQNMSRSGSNTQTVRNKEIQRLVRFFANHYNQQIHERFINLGVNDFAWVENSFDLNADPPSSNFEANFTLE